MKKFLFFLSALFLASTSQVFSQAGRKLLIMNPTVGHLSAITRLIDEGIFPLKNVQLKGVCYSKENYDYSESEKFIHDNNLPVELEIVDVPLRPDSLFCRNVCSSIFEKLFSESAGVIFLGGPDIPPAIYGENTLTLTSIYDPYRHYFEASFLFHLLGGFQNPDYVPLLETNPQFMIVGFCLGMQTMNVATGGTLIQDIPFEIYKMTDVEGVLSLPAENQHRNYETNIEDSVSYFWGNIHPVKIAKGSRLEKQGLVKPGVFPAVVSSHHQALEKTGKDMVVAATSMDGKIIEALCHSKYQNVYGFQFHPEVPDIYNYDNAVILKPGQAPEPLRKKIEAGNGYDFHLALWKMFANILNPL